MLDRIWYHNDRAILIKLMLLHTLVIAASNYLVNFKFMVLGQPFAWSTFTYPLVYISTDLTVRLLGKDTARRVVGMSFIPASVLSVFTILLAGMQLDAAIRVACASGLSYLVATLLDVYAFQWLRERYKQWWVAPGVSGVFVTIISTYIFFSAAFIGSSNEFMSANWFTVATNGVLSKVVVNTLMILPAYGLLLGYLLKRMGAPNAR